MIANGWTERAALAVGRQLRHPRGTGGRVVGALMRFGNRRPIQATVSALELQPGDHVLDIGCGDGSALAMMGIAERVAGVDQSRTMLASARQRNLPSVLSGRMALIQGDMMALPVTAGRFNKFSAINILYFCEDIPALIDSIRRTARVGSTLVIYVTAAQSMRRWAFASSATHRRFTKDDLHRELERARIPAPDRTIEPIPLPGGITGLLATVRISPDH